jgi:hypothetical protein
MKCYDDYHAFFTHKNNAFFEDETLADRAPKQATALIKFIVHKVTMKEELLLLGKYVQKLLPPKMQRVFLQKCSAFLKVDYKDANIYTLVDENLFTGKQPSPRSSNVSPRLPLALEP